MAYVDLKLSICEVAVLLLGYGRYNCYGMQRGGVRWDVEDEMLCGVGRSVEG